MGRWAREIAALDSEADATRIVHLLGSCEFAWDIERALEFALFRTYAVPSISGLLAKIGAFESDTRKRYDDTELILSEITENGLDSDRGQAALARMNAMHGAYRISNDDMLYVLSTFVFEPERWLDSYGKRALTEHEKAAIWAHYRALGHAMGILEIPEDRDAFEAFNRQYEARQFAYAESNARIGAVTRDLLLSFYLPKALIPLGRPAAHAFMDAPLLQAMGFDAAPGWLRGLLKGAMRLRAGALRLLPDRRRPHLHTRIKRPSYPRGYKIEELGTFPTRPLPK
ncbi:oxygenase MpaB family protein [Flavimaricola marinus]|uniref:ER-bound oxygenase mpaB/mpaB'/Rubber oxygenase catalytic domain-containing protein n=1 Tax=Flavimaricola marinus TaxID=1819565 RepID=A0A238LC82_9RHOB|nr:oxygenase MpaB family protein [Flavimaricola marinus]SMY07014.1 hypothetical protein LOM8899_01145 [Flavimaricola marinus]